MNTKQRILNAALTLLNEEGETAISAVDIANALEISPGNLYYHFKGKEEIIPALYDAFEEEMQIILQSGSKDMRSIEDQWIFAYIVLEEIWDFRFFYRNLDSILDRYPVLAPKFKRLLNAKRKAIRANLNNLIQLDYLHIDEVLLDTLVEQNLLCFTYWLNLQEIEQRKIPAQTAIHQSVFQIMTLSVPYMGEAGFDALQGMQALLKKNLAPK
ncbi:MAG: TetR family transcriptional regulator [Robiginitomaculum sp.]|nr:MAG: TetR family transcriptional regulator [Robiginitomaculum sp.]